MGFIEDEVVRLMQDIPPEKRHEVLRFVDELRHKYGSPKPYKSLMGLWADLGIDLSKEEIDELRREVWSISPRTNEAT